MTIIFEILAQKFPSKAFLVPNLHKVLQLDKLEAVDFKYDNIFGPRFKDILFFLHQTSSF